MAYRIGSVVPPWLVDNLERCITPPSLEFWDNAICECLREIFRPLNLKRFNQEAN